MCVFCVTAQLFPPGDSWSSGPITAPGVSIFHGDGPSPCPHVQPMGFLLCSPPANQQLAQSFSTQRARWSFSEFFFFFSENIFFFNLNCLSSLINLIFHNSSLCLFEILFCQNNPEVSVQWLELSHSIFKKKFSPLFALFLVSVENECHRYESDGRHHVRRRSLRWVSQRSKGKEWAWMRREWNQKAVVYRLTENMKINIFQVKKERVQSGGDLHQQELQIPHHQQVKNY